MAQAQTKAPTQRVNPMCSVDLPEPFMPKPFIVTTKFTVRCNSGVAFHKIQGCYEVRQGEGWLRSCAPVSKSKRRVMPWRLDFLCGSERENTFRFRLYLTVVGKYTYDGVRSRKVTGAGPAVTLPCA